MIYQRRGVVGILSAWNYPLFLSFTPLANALAAGNHVMLKPSEFAPKTADLLRSIAAELYSPEYVSVVLGEAETGAEFSRLPFDHLLYTGSARVGQLIMRAAAENLTPPLANDLARHVAATIGGTPMSTLSEILFDIPGTAHVLGGCAMGASQAQGVVDHRNRVFGYKNMYICDGSVLSANLGVNPSLTICAITERAMGFLSKASQTRWQDCATLDETPAGPGTLNI